MKRQEQKIYHCSKRQKRTAGAAISCLVLLLLYGCTYQGQASPAVAVVSDSDGSGEQASEKEITSQSGRMQGAEETIETSDADAAVSGDNSGENGRSSREEQVLTVYVCGAVKNPGVYELPLESRVYEAVGLAGGMTSEAAQTAVNQAELLVDGQMIEIPTEEEMQFAAAAEEERSDGLVNINTAGLEELKTLPGIGDSKARSIIAYREKNGAFVSIEDIKKIEGIKDGVFAKLEDCIKVE